VSSMKKTMETIEYYFIDNKTRLSDNTVKAYRISLRHFFRFVRKPYDKVKEEDIYAWLSKLLENGLSARTRNLRLISVRLFFYYAFEEGLIDQNPFADIKAVKVEKGMPYYLNRRQLAELFEATKASPRDRALVEMLYATGARISELLDIKTSDIRWGERLIWIRKGKGSKERFVLFTADCSARLCEYLKIRNDESPYIFSNGRGGHISTAWVQLICRNYSKMLGFKVTPHMLRRSLAVHMAEKDMPISYIQDILGHKNIDTTKIYTQLSSEARKKKYDSYQ